ncbi:MAG: O-antigen ligase family protein [Thermodesulfobacteriota bacterium]
METAAFRIFILTLVASPLLFGAVHTYAYVSMSLAVLTGALIVLITAIKKNPEGRDYSLYLPNSGFNLLFVFFLGFLILQGIPVPDFLLQFISPEAHAVSQKSIPAAACLATQSPTESWFAAAPFYYPVRMSLIRWTVYGLFFLGLIRLLNSQKRIELTIALLLIVGCFEALYGLVMTYSGYNHIWWFQKMSFERSVTGTYINRSHFAGYMEMCIILAISYAAALSSGKKAGGLLSTYKPPIRSRMAQFLSMEQRFNKRTLIVFFGAVMGIGLIFSASRGGIISLAGSMLCMSFLLIMRKQQRIKGFVILCFFFITLAYAISIGVEYPLERFKQIDIDYHSRLRYAQKTLDMFSDYKASGVGIGNFQYAYPKYQSAEDKYMFIRHAHNDWVQFLAEAGIIGFGLFIVGIGYFLVRLLRLWRIRNDPFAVCLGLAPLAALTAIGIHSYFDFNLHIPANFLMLSAVMAIGYSALHLDRNHREEKALHRYYVVPLKYKGMLILFLVLGLISWSGWWSFRHFVAEAYCSTVKNSTLNRNQNPSLEELKKAIVWDRANAEYWFRLGRELRRIRTQAEGATIYFNKDRVELQREGIKAFEEAVRLNPFKAEYHLELAWAYASIQEETDDYDHKWLTAADLSMMRSAYFAGEKNPLIHIHLGNYWVFRSKTLYGMHNQWEIAWNKAVWHYKKAQNVEKAKRLADEILTYVKKYYPDRDLAKEILTRENQEYLEETKTGFRRPDNLTLEKNFL